MVAIAPVGDVHTFAFASIKFNEPIDKSLFLVEFPMGWTPEVIPLNNP